MPEDRLPYANNASAVGKLATIELRTLNREDGSQTQFLRGQVEAGQDRIQFSVWPTRKKPTLAQDLYKDLPKGSYISVHGTLEEQVDEQGRIWRGIRAFGADLADEAEEARIVYYVAGHLGDLEKSIDGIYLVPITVVRTYQNAQGEEQEQETTIRVTPTEGLLRALYTQVQRGQLIRARGDVVNRGKTDRYGVTEGYEARLEVARLEVWDEQTRVWRELQPVEGGQAKQAGAAPAAAPAGTRSPTAARQAGQPAAARRAPTPKPADPDDDIPF